MSESAPLSHRGVIIWSKEYNGLLYDDGDDRFRSLVFGWDTSGKSVTTEVSIPRHGAVWGFVAEGKVAFEAQGQPNRSVGSAEFFVTENGAELKILPNTFAFAVQHLGYRAIPMLGGPIEERGRLRYIDGCSDSLLVAPSIAGDPCLNHLHFPHETQQTQHTHPSIRAGIVAHGDGLCESQDTILELRPGTIFVIPADAVHGFRTFATSMDVIAYHPDSDFGPKHEDHPMINRTLVHNEKLNNKVGAHKEAKTIEARFQLDMRTGAHEVDEREGRRQSDA